MDVRGVGPLRIGGPVTCSHLNQCSKLTSRYQDVWKKIRIQPEIGRWRRLDGWIAPRVVRVLVAEGRPIRSRLLRNLPVRWRPGRWRLPRRWRPRRGISLVGGVPVRRIRPERALLEAGRRPSRALRWPGTATASTCTTAASRDLRHHDPPQDFLVLTEADSTTVAVPLAFSILTRT